MTTFLTTPTFSWLSSVVLSLALAFFVVLAYAALNPRGTLYERMRRFDLLVFALFALVISAHLWLLVR
ncbi:hypothetical protein [Truepera radiovictrix]|uniref:hypothetical protein n=1 Tax=Truepera radiovictrix TaxID=332249 RepID=UPI0005A50F3B|nr:hypothetical protein [Truepera radiovictrix]WMT57776.1 hypothetical protein RCV51_02230 [Truepera radiovictrix]